MSSVARSAKLRIAIAFDCTAWWYSRLELLEEIIPLVIDDDERREIDHVDLADRFHPKVLEVDQLDLLDVRLREDGRRAADASQVEAAVLVAGFGDDLAAVAFRDHDHAS